MLSTDCEHNSVLRPLYRLEGVEVDFLPADRQGCIDYDDFRRLLRPNTRGIVCTHGSNLTGNLLDIRTIGRFAKEHGLLLVVDASPDGGGVRHRHGGHGHRRGVLHRSQKACWGRRVPADCASLRGWTSAPSRWAVPVCRRICLSSRPSTPTRLEAGTLNGHGIAGLSAALDYLEETGLEAIRSHEQALARQFYEGVSAIPGVTVYGDFTTWDRAPVVSLNIRDYDSSQVSDVLAEQFSIATRPGAHCAPGCTGRWVRWHRGPCGSASAGSTRRRKHRPPLRQSGVLQNDRKKSVGFLSPSTPPPRPWPWSSGVRRRALQGV